MGYKIVFSKQAKKDAELIIQAKLKTNVEKIIEILKNNPFQPPCEKLIGDLKGAYSKRINLRHRLVYQVYEKEKVVKVLKMWTHYE
jgi:toxin YoeB